MSVIGSKLSRRDLGRLGAAAATLAAMAGGGAAVAQAQTKAPAAPATATTGGGTIKIGVLHSLSGTMAISETTLKDVMLMLIEEQNQKGGLLGKKLEPVVVDPASNWPLFAEKARELITKDKVAATFGCWTSVSRKSVLPVFQSWTASCSTPSSTRARRARATSSTAGRRRTSRRSPPSTT